LETIFLQSQVPYPPYVPYHHMLFGASAPADIDGKTGTWSISDEDEAAYFAQLNCWLLECNISFIGVIGVARASAVANAFLTLDVINTLAF